MVNTPTPGIGAYSVYRAVNEGEKRPYVLSHVASDLSRSAANRMAYSLRARARGSNSKEVFGVYNGNAVRSFF